MTVGPACQKGRHGAQHERLLRMAKAAVKVVSKQEDDFLMAGGGGTVGSPLRCMEGRQSALAQSRMWVARAKG